MKKLMNALKAFISRPFLDTFYRKKKKVTYFYDNFFIFPIKVVQY